MTLDSAAHAGDTRPAAHVAYRRDIDGLRSVAVLSVILYHFHFAAFAGGYVGVDVFFVISGFLIGPRVLDGVIDRSFSRAAFFEARIRRLYPALFVTLLLTSVVSCFLLLPVDLREFGRSLVATVVYASNIQFYREAGYFDAEAITKPLLHTWSLAVEEQFYILLPILAGGLALLRLKSAHLRGALAALMAASFLLAAYQAYDNQPAAFFLFPARLWELGLGMVVAYLKPSWRPVSRVALWMALAGFALILVPVLTYSDRTIFPGIAAIPPCLGTALILLAGRTPDNMASRLLAARIPVGVGLISYSLYLWHWPIIVLMTYWYQDDFNLGERLLGIALTFLFATLSWRFVERPFRDKRFLRRGQVFGLAFGASALMLALGLILWRTDGLPGRYSPSGQRLAYAAGDFIQSGGVCDKGPIALGPGLQVCRIGRLDRAPTILVWGDSHARAFRDGLHQAAIEHDTAALLVWQGGCPPLFDVRKTESSPTTDRECMEATDRLRAWLRTDTGLRTVLLVGRWAYYTEGSGVGADIRNRITLQSRSAPSLDARKTFADALERTVDELRGQRRSVFVLEQVPEIDRFDSRHLARVVLAGRRTLEEEVQARAFVTRNAVDARQAAPRGAIARLAAAGKLRTISVDDYFCDAQRCTAWIDDLPAIFDNNHVTVETSLRLRDRFGPVFDNR